ncbi:SGNH/GDSL hydrolase family protein [Sphingomonas sp. 37zxx]|uniref:SGNH/GDSL hydrolase family protein n=1 Tax=Sphingomonas sp. 37zxx TaxID=1550073 RepID=UPI00068E528F|nr:SGNH/GDSL hydrolase family protein [Sphingomonas sp. 37zxx]
MKMIRRLFLGLLCLIALGAVLGFGYFYWQGSKVPDTTGDYVALGSSFAAGIGLGAQAGGSPVQCLRSKGGYPSLVARQTGLKLVDMSCSGSTSQHILDGGQMMLGPQLAAVGPAARLVTLTTGGNDLGYIGDLVASSGGLGVFGRLSPRKIEPAADRPYPAVARNIGTIIARIRERAPRAVIVVVNYPRVLPVRGSCAALGISQAQADISREVARRLAVMTKQAALRAGAHYVDMDAASAGHDACSAVPWVRGAEGKWGSAFHPNAAGAAASAQRVMAAASANM